MKPEKRERRHRPHKIEISLLNSTLKPRGDKKSQKGPKNTKSKAERQIESYFCLFSPSLPFSREKALFSRYLPALFCFRAFLARKDPKTSLRFYIIFSSLSSISAPFSLFEPRALFCPFFPVFTPQGLIFPDFPDFPRNRPFFRVFGPQGLRGVKFAKIWPFFANFHEKRRFGASGANFRSGGQFS